MKTIYIPSSAVAAQKLSASGIDPIAAAIVATQAKLAGLAGFTATVKEESVVIEDGATKQVVDVSGGDVAMLNRLAAMASRVFPGAPANLGTSLWEKHAANHENAQANVA
jgi:hypothetical protein